MNRPASSFFIVGAPRCGTTSLSKILGSHHEVCFSYPKETHFFARDNVRYSHNDLENTFVRAFFPDLAPHHRLLGEGSPSNLYSSDALRAINAFDPTAKIIVCVRNPIDMVYSLHARLVYTMDEDVRDFATAWSLQQQRSEGKSVPARCRDARLLLYGDIGKHAMHLERLFQLIATERCRVVMFDDLVRDTAAVYRDLCWFLGVADDNRHRFPAKKSNREFKNAFVQQILVNPPGLLRPLMDRLMFSSNSAFRTMWKHSRRPRKWLKRRNRQVAMRRPLSRELRDVLYAHFASDIDDLSVLLGRDLSHWR
jgi:hypothetical protein